MPTAVARFTVSYFLLHLSIYSNNDVDSERKKALFQVDHFYVHIFFAACQYSVPDHW